jgi:hypothetical protein
VLALEGVAPLVGEAPFTAAAEAAAAAAEFLERMRSAHDLGAALGAGVVGSVDLASSELPSGRETAESVAGALSLAEASAASALGLAAGTAGTIGTAGLESFFAWL